MLFEILCRFKVWWCIQNSDGNRNHLRSVSVCQTFSKSFLPVCCMCTCFVQFTYSCDEMYFCSLQYTFKRVCWEDFAKQCCFRVSSWERVRLGPGYQKMLHFDAIKVYSPPNESQKENLIWFLYLNCSNYLKFEKKIFVM